ncbi:MRN complex-interacting protein [Rhinophrynus dorsalis]
MVQEFYVLRCFSCQTFQVHQVKKSKKWNCKLCGEKQSLLKVYGQGSGADCRHHVQKLNLLQGEVQLAADNEAQLTWQKENTVEEPDEDAEERSLDSQQESGGSTSHWKKYLDEEACVAQEFDNEEDESMVYTDRQQFYSQQKKAASQLRKRKKKACNPHNFQETDVNSFRDRSSKDSTTMKRMKNSEDWNILPYREQQNSQHTQSINPEVPNLAKIYEKRTEDGKSPDTECCAQSKWSKFICTTAKAGGGDGASVPLVLQKTEPALSSLWDQKSPNVHWSESSKETETLHPKKSRAVGAVNDRFTTAEMPFECVTWANTRSEVAQVTNLHLTDPPQKNVLGSSVSAPLPNPITALFQTDEDFDDHY